MTSLALYRGGGSVSQVPHCCCQIPDKKSLKGGRVLFWLTPRGETVHCEGRRVRELSTPYLQSGSNKRSRARSRHLKAGLPVTYFLQ